MEAYLNIIEFGPDIFGIENACAFYFSKSSRELSLAESLILSYIIPRPKYFLGNMQSNPELMLKKLQKHVYFHLFMMKMRQHISQAEFNITMDACKDPSFLPGLLTPLKSFL